MTAPSGVASGTLRRTALATLRFFSTLILVAGACVICLVLLEAVVRAWIGVSAARVSAATVAGPMAGKPWVRDFNKEFDATRNVQWEPYVYFRRIRPYHGKYVNIDSQGHRITPQPMTPTTPDARVFFLGGSTMWGSFQRDDHTVPAEASRRLQALVGAGHRIDVTNLGEQGWVNSQEVVELMLQLRAGQRPDVVVFMDGINDPFATLQAGKAGIPENEQKRATEFALGRKLDRTLYGHGLASDIRAIGALALAVLDHLETMQKLRTLVHRPDAPILAADSAARATAAVYEENVRIVEALSRAYDFTPIYLWQPTLHATDKKPTQFEARLLKSIAANPLQRRLGETYREMPRYLDSTMATIAHERFVDATHVFKDSTLPVFPDIVGHNTEESIPTIVDAFWPELQQVVAARLKARSAAH